MRQHCAELPLSDKVVVEKAFRDGTVSVLVATSTLAAGVNLPAERVIIVDPWVARPDRLLDVSRYQQMAGRAGRAGLCASGEAILVVDQKNPARVKALEGLVTKQVRSGLA